MFDIIFQDIDCVVDNKKKPDLVISRELPAVHTGKKISMECSSSTVKMVANLFSLS